mmetsp:Transcript_76155/g.178676  ORF Transcript_76155/g.178676 Transcript_76155/m.178676 type:complete len:253 (+) Transcript_76155:368-1126(+)
MVDDAACGGEVGIGREGVDGEQRPVLVLEAKGLVVARHHQTTSTVPRRLALVGCGDLDRLGAGDGLAGPNTLPASRGDPDGAGRLVVDGVGDGRDQEVVQEDVLCGGRRLGERWPEHVATSDEGSGGRAGVGGGGDEAGGETVAQLKVGFDGGKGTLAVTPGTVIGTVEPQDGSKHTMPRPAQEVASRELGSVVSAAVRVYVGLETVQSGADHGVDRRFEGDVVASPPHRVPVLRQRLLRMKTPRQGLVIVA